MPRSGPFRFDLQPGSRRWVYRRDGRDLLHQLEAELKALTGKEVKL